MLIVFIIIAADQTLKFWIKTHMMLGEEIHIFGNWFIIHFVENNGMAFGFELSGNYGKMVLSIFRVIAVFAIGWFLIKLSKKEVPRGFMVSLALIFAGAIGNIIDSVFYGVLFDQSYGQYAEFLPAGGGYARLLHGKVVDMFYFPIINIHYPGWFPIWGGEELIFFRPVFNIADSSITVGIFSILIFYKNFFNELSFKKVVKKEMAEEQVITITDADAGKQA
jgi:signal peptidase II